MFSFLTMCMYTCSTLLPYWILNFLFRHKNNTYVGNIKLTIQKTLINIDLTVIANSC